MIHQATERMVVAVAATVLGTLAAVLGGLPEAAVLVTPWAVLLVLGFTSTDRRSPEVSVDVAQDRVLMGDDVEVLTSVSGVGGSIHVTSVPSDGFLEGPNPGGAHGVHEALIGERAEVRILFPAERWGVHDLGRIRLRLLEPYGLFQREVIVGGEAQVRVHPTPTQLRNLLAPRLVRRVSGAHLSKAAGRGIEYADIRPFTSGDSLRDINWRASARAQELWVSQRHPDRATDVVLLLDSFVESGHDVHTIFGLAIEAAVALAESHLVATDRVGLVEMGGIVRWVSPGTGRYHLQRLTDAMLSTGLFANAAWRSLHGIPPRVLPPRSFVVALTPLLDERFIDALFVLGGRGHDVAVIECVAGEPSTPDPSPSDGSSELSRLVDRLGYAERQIVRDRLAESGIAIGSWRRGGHLDTTLAELSRRRRRTVRASHRR